MPYSGSQSSFLSLRVLGGWAPWIMCDWDLTSAIEIRPFIQPAHAKWVCLFSLPWFDSVAQVRTRLTSSACRWKKVQTDKNVSIGCDSSYRAYPSWLFPTKSVVPPLDHICRNPHQLSRVWCQWCLQTVNTIKLGSWHHPVSNFPCHSSDRSHSLIWYIPDGLVVRHVLMLR